MVLVHIRIMDSSMDKDPLLARDWIRMNMKFPGFLLMFANRGSTHHKWVIGLGQPNQSSMKIVMIFLVLMLRIIKIC